MCGDMEKLEKVIKGLECCVIHVNCAADGGCPYIQAHAGCLDTAIKDALALLKAQEPRVIPFNEIDNHEILWMEVLDVKTEDGLAPWVKTRSGRWFSPLLCSDAQPDMTLATPEEYGRICRCWTSRPTDEQREAVKWG